MTVDVYNGSGTPGLAGDASQAFASPRLHGRQGRQRLRPVADLQDDTQVFYGAGAEANADSIAARSGP